MTACRGKTFLLALAMLATSACSSMGREPVSGDDEAIVSRPSEPVIQPELDRRDVTRASIDTEDWEADLEAIMPAAPSGSDTVVLSWLSEPSRLRRNAAIWSPPASRT